MTATTTATRTPARRNQRVRLHPERTRSSRNVAMIPSSPGEQPPKRAAAGRLLPVEEASWWAVRRAQSERPATYRCSFCDELLHAMNEHLVIAPEGNADRRRHAHTPSACSRHGRPELSGCTTTGRRAANPARARKRRERSRP